MMMIIKIKKINKKIKNLPIIMNQIKNRVSHLSSFPLIFYNLDINVNDSDPVITQLAYGVFLLSLVALFCLINIIGYLLTYYLIQKGNYEVKYPKLTRLINYYKNTTLVFIIIEIILCLICLGILIFYSYLIIFHK
jgi:putative copper export protein